MVPATLNYCWNRVKYLPRKSFLFQNLRVSAAGKRDQGAHCPAEFGEAGKSLAENCELKQIGLSSLKLQSQAWTMGME